MHERQRVDRMKTVKKYLLNNWPWLTIGVLLTAVSVKMAHIERGYVAYGGEWLIIPLILTIAVVMNR